MAIQDTIRNAFLRDNRKANPMMMRRARVACVVLIVIILLAAYGGNLRAYIGNLAVKDYFGDYYAELWHRANVSDKQSVVAAAALIEEAFAFEGTQEEAEEKFGILARYCGHGEGGYELKFVTASAEAGCLWITYSNDSSKDILVRFAIEDGVVTDILEHP